ncbi:MAG: tyrosine--tRNA ligase [Alphaproteobacteria bacterium]|nr:tyrosine--tRNA ligase [Alphaproteobacteria bacterium]
MPRFKSDLLNVLSERGHINQCTDFEALDAKASQGTITAYIGYDATANSLHVGNLATIMMLHRLQQTGHRPIVLMGGGTTKVGDPSGKDELRKVLSDETIASNFAGIRKAFDKFLTFGNGPKDAIMVNNADWLDELGYIAFLRDIGRHFTINRMLTFDSVKLRLEREQPLTFLEFNYMIMQGYDFVELYDRYGCTLQMGGADQWGNIVNGVELGRRMKNIELFGLTTPLITTSSGTKMGKSVSGAIWIDKDRLNSYDYWQFWRNTEDADVVRFLKLFTDLPLDEIAKLEKLRDAEINEAKKILAFEATKMAHGEQAAQEAAETARAVFEDKASSDNLPTYDLAKGSAPLIVDVIVALGMAASRGEAKRLIEQKGVKINDTIIPSVSTPITDQDVGSGAKLSVGKKKHALIKIV